MNEFGLWFNTGLGHILDFKGYDHILFVALLALSQPIKEWKKLLLLITAFTLGHSFSLALSVSGIIYLPQVLIEFCIALTILASAFYQILTFKKEGTKMNYFFYVIITLFGLVHGMGFSLLLRSMLGHEQSVVLPLLSFNLGLELGQIIIVLLVLVFSLLLTSLLKWPTKPFKIIVVCSIALIALKMSAERLLDLFYSF